MMTQYLKAIDRDLLNKYTQFNLGYLSDLKLNLFNPMPDDYFLKNILAKDEMDAFKVTPADASRKLHSALARLIERIYFLNEEESCILNGLMTYLDISMSPDLSHITRLLSGIQELHREIVEIEVGDDGLIVYSKMLYNRSRIMALQTRGLNDVENSLTTNFDQLIDTTEVAATMARMNSIHHALKSIKMSVIPNMKDKVICGMIVDISEAMLTYRRSLIAPEKAGLGDFDLAASEAALMQKDPTPAAGENLTLVINSYSEKDLAFTPADFLLSLNEGIRLSGINLMV